MTIPIGIQGSHFTQPPVTGTYEAGYIVGGTTATTLSITQANMGNVASGNVVVAFVFSFVDEKSGVYMGLPTGFTQRATMTGVGRRLVVGTKTAGGSEGTYTTAAGASVFHSAFACVEASGVTAFSVASTDNFSTDNSLSIPSASSTPGGLIVGFQMQAVATTCTPNQGTERLELTPLPGDPWGIVNVFTHQMPSSGATGDMTATHDGGTTYAGGAFVVLN